MQRGFLAAVPGLVLKYPGRNEKQLAELYLRNGGRSDSKEDPIESLGNTLYKYRFRVLGVRIDTVGRGKRQYYPADSAKQVDTRPSIAQGTWGTVSVRVTPLIDAILNALLEIGQFSSRSDAANWLMEQGYELKKTQFEQLTREVEELQKRKEELRKRSEALLA